MKVVAGIDIGGTNTKFGIVDETGSCLACDSVLTTEFGEPGSFARAVSSRIRKMLRPGNILTEVGIGAPNGNFHRGTVDDPPNLPWKGVIPLAELFRHEVHVRCVLDNDANAAAIGEMRFGGARGMNDFVFITLGTGLGSGIVSNGQLIYGHEGVAGELGHIIVREGGRLCGCGRRGCLETYASATGIRRTVEEWLNCGKASRLAKLSAIRSADICEAALKGDVLAVEAFEFTGKILGTALANCIAITGSEAIFLFGGLANAKELLFEPVRRHLEANLLGPYRNRVKLLPSTLKENQAAILGAASLVWTHTK